MQRRRILILLILVLLAIIVVLVAIIPRPVSVPIPPPPSHLLLYRQNNVPWQVDLNTNQHTKSTLEAFFDPRVSISSSPDKAWTLRKQVVKEWTIYSVELESVSAGTVKSLGDFPLCSAMPSWSFDSQKLVFSFIVDPSTAASPADYVRCEIHIYDLASGDLTRVTDNNIQEADVAFSPDGTRLVFNSTEDGYYRLYIMDLATQTRILLTPDSFGFRPAWSPDGQWIAFMSNHDHWNDNIYIIRPDATDLRQLTDSDAPEDYPEWLTN